MLNSVCFVAVAHDRMRGILLCRLPQQIRQGFATREEEKKRTDAAAAAAAAAIATGALGGSSQFFDVGTRKVLALKGKEDTD